MADLIRATYIVSSPEPFDVEKKAQGIALGQTTDTWTPTERGGLERLERHRGRVVDVGEAVVRDGLHTAEITIDYPPENTEGDIATLLVMVFGKVSMDGSIRLAELELPASFTAGLPGPRFGVEGMRRLLGVDDRPLVMSIFKPCVGLTPDDLAAMFREQAEGGTDVVKDDEILPNLESCPTERRLEQCLEAARAVESVTGHKTLYALNLTGSAGEIVDRARELARRGATCFLLNVLAYGYGTLEALARDPEVGVPIVAHPAVAGAIGSAPRHGIAYHVVLGTLMRAAGADVVLFPSSYGTVALRHDETEAIRDRLTRPMQGVAAAFPGPSAGIHPGLTPRIVADYGRDVVINAGGGVHGHPMGSRAGAVAFRQSVDLALEGTDPSSAVVPELAAALKLWS